MPYGADDTVRAWPGWRRSWRVCSRRSANSPASPQPLSGGITNHNFRVTLGGEDYVVRLHGRDTDLLGIDREAERIASEPAAELGIAPERRRRASRTAS